MTFLFADFTDTDWKQYFDVIIVDARKPLFFAGGMFNCVERLLKAMCKF